jgi:hypothetical protein
MRPLVFALVLLTATAAFFVPARPASASISSAVTTASPASYTGKCPVTVQFFSTINGSDGTQFQYTYESHLNGVQSLRTGGSGTISGGSFTPLPDSIVVTSSTDGSKQNSGQVWVHNIPGQNDVYSPPANFTVVCTQPGGGGTFKPTNHPTNLHATNDARECAAHNGYFVCAMIANNELVLVWDYNPARSICIGKIGGPIPRCAKGDDLHLVDGYKIYRVDGGRNDLVRTQQAGQQYTAADIDKPAGGYQGNCYAASAYHGLVEGPLSNTFCVGGGTPIGLHTFLLPQRWTHRYRFHQRSSLPTEPFPACDALCVGYDIDSQNGTDFGWQHATVWRSYLLFDPAVTSGRHFHRATLKLLTLSGDGSCLDRVSAANGDWWSNSDSWVDGDFSNGDQGRVSRSGAVIDVTNIVRGWANGSPNFGFVLTGRFEDTGANTTAKCLVDFRSNALLDLEV